MMGMMENSKCMRNFLYLAALSYSNALTFKLKPISEKNKFFHLVCPNASGAHI
jgi:hypothetical protein